MHYYKVYLPLGIQKDFSYASKDKLPFGTRVVVPLKAKPMMGLCGEEVRSEGYKYREIIEVLDDESILPLELFELAKWMANYYHLSIGRVLFAMLPSRLQIDIDAKISWISETKPPHARFEPLYEALKGQDELRLSQIKKQLKNQAIYALCEEAFDLELISYKSKLRRRDKPKVRNFIRIIQHDFDEDKLPLRQREAWELIKVESEPFPMADVSNLISYSAIKALVGKGIIEIFQRELREAELLRDTGAKAKDIVLNDEQNTAIAEMSENFGKYGVHLLYGITGSGKTEVYIEMIRKYQKVGKSVIFLIPEIALTPQMLDRFDSSFGDSLAVLHSQLTDAQRFNQWQNIRSGKCKLIIGARSAIFAPAVDLGLIIVDEEHEQSYKQDNNPRYNGRDMAIVRGKLQGAQVILGSATPSLESWNNALEGRYTLHRMMNRPLDFSLPEVKIIDMRDAHSKEIIGEELSEAIADRLDKNEQVILFQNRRGYSSFVQCLKCGELVSCPNCEIGMHYHRDREEMHCHYCGHFYPSPRRCPKCGSFSFAYGSPGTQKVEQTLKLLFPSARILRLDSDSSSTNLKSMYKRMKNRDIDILLGTQMITKGLDFPLVTLVGIINADIALNIPDFRSAERSFQLITQVAGRSGRAERKGEVIIQTFNPEHYAIRYAKEQNFCDFAEIELRYRKKLYYPPYYRLGRMLFQSTDIQQLKAEMLLLSEALPKRDGSLLILGPVQAPIPKINMMHRYHIIIKAQSPAILKDAIKHIENNFKGKLKPQIDIDPAILM